MEERRLVLAAVISRSDRFLVCLRPAHKRHGGLWEFPGGKLEAGESLVAAAVREIKEELGVGVTDVEEPMFVHADPGSAFDIAFSRLVINGEPTPTEHGEVRWLPMPDIARLSLAPSDAAFVAWFMIQPS